MDCPRWEIESDAIGRGETCSGSRWSVGLSLLRFLDGKCGLGYLDGFIKPGVRGMATNLLLETLETLETPETMRTPQVRLRPDRRVDA